jgi:hypothetical protein
VSSSGSHGRLLIDHHGGAGHPLIRLQSVRSERNAESDSSCFIEPEKLIVLLHDLAARIGTASDEHGYGDNQAVRLENGRKALDYMEAHERFSAARFKDSMGEQGIAVHQDDLIPLIDNVRSLSKERRSSIGKHGELLFYIDAC